ncbi:MAG TPA: hypothetical protein VEP67_11380 [Thiobacillaceae bacterium]|nr:hypothetical protein [Thiobacillaceae bacterium]
MPATSWFIQIGTRVMPTMTAIAIAFPIDRNTLFLFRQERVARIRNRSPDANEHPKRLLSQVLYQEAAPAALKGTRLPDGNAIAHRKSLSCFLRIL